MLPIAKSGQTRPAGFVVAGVSPRLIYNDDYKGFLELLAGHIATAIANARAYEEERRRAEALAELDRAKTAFFSNVSHEFRTPLTLILGPVSDALAAPTEQPTPLAVGTDLDVVHRNALRLQRLVNTLLDFSRIEAGRVRASYRADRPGRLHRPTSPASSARPARRPVCDLEVDCPPLPEPVHVDREMWEKIVLNLLSNAFKFTFEGRDRPSPLRQTGRAAVLDGAGHRRGHPGRGDAAAVRAVPPGRERTRVGPTKAAASAWPWCRNWSSCTAADLRRERSRPGDDLRPCRSRWARSTCRPTDRRQRPRPATTAWARPVRRGSAALAPRCAGQDPAAESATDRDDSSPAPVPARQATTTGPVVLVADDNADMRQYLVRLAGRTLRRRGRARRRGGTGRGSRRRRPDLILTDVMMPRLDGFGLLRELRADPRTATVPVILLSARAGEESRVEGMEAGADDYLVKPFSARELLARVAAHLQMARLRREAETTPQRERGTPPARPGGLEDRQSLSLVTPATGVFRSFDVNLAFRARPGSKRSGSPWDFLARVFPDDGEHSLWFERYGNGAI